LKRPKSTSVLSGGFGREPYLVIDDDKLVGFNAFVFQVFQFKGSNY